MNYNNVIFETSVGTAGQMPPSDLPEICFSGRSNVGKSSLINRLLGRKSLARVSTKPGKTVTVNFFRLEDVRLADLPGYGYAKVSFSEKKRWSELMEHYFGSGRNIALVIQLVDMRHKPSADDIDMLKFLIHAGFNFCVVLTKSDKLNKSQRAERLEALGNELGFVPKSIPIIPFSSSNGEGVEDVRRLIEEIDREEKNFQTSEN